MRSLKKLLAVLLAAAMMMFIAVPPVYADDDENNDGGTINTSIPPEFALSSGKEFEMLAGTSSMIGTTVSMVNNGTYSYVVMSVSGGTSDVTVDDREYRFTPKNPSEFGAGFIVTAKATAPADTYSFNLNVSAYDTNGLSVCSKTFAIKVKVKSKLQLKGLIIDSFKVSKDNIRPGDHFDIEVTLKNNTGIDVKNAELHLDGIDTNKFVLDKGFSKQYLDIAKGKTGTTKFSLIAQNGIALVRESLNLVLSYSLDETKSNLTSQSTTQVIISCVPNEAAAKYGAHDISMTRYKVSSTEVEKGTKFDLTIELKNSGSDDIVNARVAIVPDAAKFSIDSGLSYSDFSIKKGETKTFTFKLIGGSGIASEREAIPVKIEYGSQNAEFQTVVSCKAGSGKNSGKYDVAVTDYSINVDSVAESTVFDLSFAVTNTSTSDISHARVTVMNLDGTKFAIDSGLPYSDFDIGSGETKQFTFRLVGCKGLASIREVVPIQIDYGEVSTSYNATIKCVPKDSSGTDNNGKKVFAPNIIIESYSFGGDFATAGKQFPLTVNIKNVSDKAVIENLKVTVNGKPMQDGSIAYSPANSSNSFFFDTLPCKGTQTIELDLLPKADAVPNSYPVEIDFTYEYSVNNERFQATGIAETLTIPLRQEDRLVINEPEIPNWGINVGELCTINISLVNKGKSAVYNVTATVQGEGFTAESPTYYIGNVNSGTEEYYDAKLTPMQEGDISGEIIFTYEDANGESKENRIPFTFMAMNMMGGMDMNMDGMEGFDMPAEEESGFPLWAYFAIGGGVLAIAAIIVIVVKEEKS
jgi:hypothetical protein